MKIKSKTILFTILAITLILSGGYFYYSKDDNIDKNKNSGDINDIQNENPGQVLNNVKWVDHNSIELGFSMRFPEEVLGLYKCDSPQKFTVPLMVFEDNERGVVYLVPEYYYEANWNRELLEFTGECKKVTYSLDTLENRTQSSVYYFSNKPMLGYAIFVRDIKSDADLNSLIKEVYGSSCNLGPKDKITENGVDYYRVSVKSSGIEGDCPMNYSYKILYSIIKNKALALVVGQGCTFSNEYEEPSLYQCYDQEIIDSFRLQ
jgi:hypothetical protein